MQQNENHPPTVLATTNNVAAAAAAAAAAGGREGVGPHLMGKLGEAAPDDPADAVADREQRDRNCTAVHTRVGLQLQ